MSSENRGGTKNQTAATPPSNVAVNAADTPAYHVVNAMDTKKVA